jgi:hypothetical protein
VAVSMRSLSSSTSTFSQPCSSALPSRCHPRWVLVVIAEDTCLTKGRLLPRPHDLMLLSTVA